MPVVCFERMELVTWLCRWVSMHRQCRKSGYGKFCWVYGLHPWMLNLQDHQLEVAWSPLFKYENSVARMAGSPLGSALAPSCMYERQLGASHLVILQLRQAVQC